MAPAAVSALTLYAWPSASVPMVATTGIRSSSGGGRRIAGVDGARRRRRSRAPGRGRSRSGARRPRPTGRRRAGAWTLMAATMSRLTLPTSTIRAMSSVSASVTRRPSRNSGSLPRRCHQLADLRAAAVDDDGPHARPECMQHDVLGEEVQLVDAVAVAPWRCRRTSPRRPCRGSAGCTAGPRRGRRPCRRRARPPSSRGPHVLVDVGVGEVVGEDGPRAVADAEVADDLEVPRRPCGPARPPRRGRSPRRRRPRSTPP